MSSHSRVVVSLLWALSILALCLAACSTSTAPAPQPVPPPQDTGGRLTATQREIETVVFDAQRAGFERRDLAGYMAAWSADARLIGGRSERPGPHDFRLTRSQIEATKRERFSNFPKLRLSFETKHFERDGDTALLQTLSTLLDPDGRVEQNAEFYRLRKDGGSWKVYENRYWPVRVISKTGVVVYSAETWRKLDASVEATAPGTLERVYALLDAFRMREAYIETIRLTQMHADYVPAWYLRYQVALLVGVVEDVQVCNESIARLEKR